MPQLISIAAQTSPKFDTIIASPFDLGNIQDAFMYYHYGIPEKGQEPAEKSIHSYLKRVKNILSLEELTIEQVLETYNLLEDFYSNSSGSIENINDVTIFEGPSASAQNINNNLLQIQNSFNNINQKLFESFNVQSSSYTLQLSDNNKIIIANRASTDPMVILIPLDSESSFPIGTNIEIVNIGQSSVFIEGDSIISLDPKVPSSSVMVRGESLILSKTSSRANRSKAIYKRASDDWVVIQ